MLKNLINSRITIKIYIIVLLILISKSVLSYNEELYIFSCYNILFILIIANSTEILNKLIITLNYNKILSSTNLLWLSVFFLYDIFNLQGDLAQCQYDHESYKKYKNFKQNFYMNASTFIDKEFYSQEELKTMYKAHYNTCNANWQWATQNLEQTAFLLEDQDFFIDLFDLIPLKKFTKDFLIYYSQAKRVDFLILHYLLLLNEGRQDTECYSLKAKFLLIEKLKKPLCNDNKTFTYDVIYKYNKDYFLKINNVKHLINFEDFLSILENLEYNYAHLVFALKQEYGIIKEVEERLNNVSFLSFEDDLASSRQKNTIFSSVLRLILTQFMSKYVNFELSAEHSKNWTELYTMLMKEASKESAFKSDLHLILKQVRTTNVSSSNLFIKNIRQTLQKLEKHTINSIWNLKHNKMQTNNDYFNLIFRGYARFSQERYIEDLKIIRFYLRYVMFCDIAELTVTPSADPLGHVIDEKLENLHWINLSKEHQIYWKMYTLCKKHSVYKGNFEDYKEEHLITEEDQLLDFYYNKIIKIYYN